MTAIRSVRAALARGRRYAENASLWVPALLEAPKPAASARASAPVTGRITRRAFTTGSHAVGPASCRCTRCGCACASDTSALVALGSLGLLQHLFEAVEATHA
jgi:hypothetical protein